MATRRKSAKSGKKGGGRKYGKAASRSVESAMRRRKSGTLRSGRGGRGGKVTSRAQAIAIGLSEARERGAKVPKKASGSRKKSSGAGAASRARKSAGSRKAAGRKSAGRTSAGRSR